MGTAAIGVGISFSKLYFFHVFLVVLLFSVLYLKRGIIKDFFPKSWVEFIPFVFIAWYFISLVWAFSLSHAVRYLFYLMCGLSILLTISKYATTKKRINDLYRVLKIVFTVEIVIAILEGMSLFRWPISPFSSLVSFFGRQMATRHLVNQNTIDSLLAMPTGFHWNPNDLSLVMVMVFPFCLLLPNLIKKITGVAAIFSIITMTGSRGNLLALILILGVYFFFYQKKKALSFLIAGFGIIVFLLLEEVTYISNIQQGIATSVEALRVFLFEDVQHTLGSLGVRQKLIFVGLQGLQETFGLGLGAGGSVAYVEMVGGIGSHKVTSLHNFWIEVLVEGGVLIFLVLIVWYFSLWRHLYLVFTKTTDERLKYYSGALSLSFVGFALGAISSSSVVYFFPMWIMFGLSIALLKIYNSNSLESTTHS